MVKVDPNFNGNPGPTPRIGFYGCRGELVRVELNPKPYNYPRALTIDSCPACGHGHGVTPYWRKRMERDDGKATLVIDYEI